MSIAEEKQSPAEPTAESPAERVEGEWIKTPEPRIYYDVDAETYHRWDAMSQSQIKPLAKSPRHLLQYRKRGIDSESIRLGLLTDTLVFEPDEFSKRFIMRPANYENDKGEVKPWNANANVCKEMLRQYEASGLPVITTAQHRAASMMARAVRSHKAAKQHLANGRAQVSLVWDDSESGIRCKARLDWLRSDGIDDLKTTRDASPDGFPGECTRYKYHIQAAMYVDGYAALTGDRLPFSLIAVENHGFHPVAVYTVEPESIVAGRSIYKRALFSYRQCKASGAWPAYSDFEEPINISRWALREELGEEIANVGF